MYFFEDTFYFAAYVFLLSEILYILSRVSRAAVMREQFRVTQDLAMRRVPFHLPSLA